MVNLLRPLMGLLQRPRRRGPQPVVVTRRIHPGCYHLYQLEGPDIHAGRNTLEYWTEWGE